MKVNQAILLFVASRATLFCWQALGIAMNKRILVAIFLVVVITKFLLQSYTEPENTIDMLNKAQWQKNNIGLLTNHKMVVSYLSQHS